VDAALDGMVIELGDGIFAGVGNREVEVASKAITIRSHAGDWTRCTVDCQGTGRAFHFQDVAAPGAVLSGITIANGNSGAANGGGVSCAGSSVTVAGCRFVNNTTSEKGGGLAVTLCPEIIVQDCLFLSNSSGAGGGFACLGSSLAIERTTFADNWSPSENGGAGILTRMDGQGSGAYRQHALRKQHRTLPGLLPSHSRSNDHCLLHRRSGCGMGHLHRRRVLRCLGKFRRGRSPGLRHRAERQHCGGSLVCDAPAGDFSLREDSPCLPAQNPDCGRSAHGPRVASRISQRSPQRRNSGSPPLPCSSRIIRKDIPTAGMDFENDGQIDAMAQNPSTNTEPRTYSVRLSTYLGGSCRPRCSDRTTSTLSRAIISSYTRLHHLECGVSSAHPMDRRNALGAVSLFIEFNPAKVTYAACNASFRGRPSWWGSGEQGVDPVVRRDGRPGSIDAGRGSGHALCGALRGAGDPGHDQLRIDQAESVLGIATAIPCRMSTGSTILRWDDHDQHRSGRERESRLLLAGPRSPRRGAVHGPPDSDIITNELGEYAFPAILRRLCHSNRQERRP